MMRSHPVSVDEWLDYIGRIHVTEIDLTLDRVRTVFKRLNAAVSAQVITVAGTNGKGSTCAFLESVLRSAGYRVGCYASPHLLRFNERIRLNGQEISDEQLVAAFEKIESIRDNTSLTYFEFTTLAAWWIFSASPLDAIILEVGLGGRLDAVNVIDADCVVLTSIGIDHVAYLGHTREAIGLEKAGVFRRGRPVVCAEPDLPSVVFDYANSMGAHVYRMGHDFGYCVTPLDNGQASQQWSFWLKRAEALLQRGGLAFSALRGRRQLANAAAALAALYVLEEKLPIDMQAIRRGLLEVSLPGRFQVMPGQPSVIFDVAHNAHAIRVLRENLQEMSFSPTTYAVWGVLADKDIDDMIVEIVGQIDVWLVVDLPMTPRAASGQQLFEKLICHDVSEKNISLHAAPAEALQHVLTLANPHDRIVIFGSFFTVAHAMDYLQQRMATSHAHHDHR